MKFNHNNQRTLSQNLKYTFASIILTFVLIFIPILCSLWHLFQHFKTIEDLHFPLIETVQSATVNHLSTENITYKLCLSTQASKQAQYIQEQNTYDMQLQANLKSIRTYAPQYKETVTLIQRALQDAVNYRQKAILYCKQNRSQEALNFLEKDYFPLMNQIQEQLNLISNQIIQENHTFLTRYKIQALLMIVLSLFILIVVLFYTARLMNQLIKKVQLPLTEIELAMCDMAQGNLQFDLLL